MLHAWVERFDVMDRRRNILGWDGEVNKALVHQKVHNAKRRFSITSNLRYMHRVLNVDEIKN
jgi:hypothetical protein